MRSIGGPRAYPYIYIRQSEYALTFARIGKRRQHAAQGSYLKAVPPGLGEQRAQRALGRRNAIGREEIAGFIEHILQPENHGVKFLLRRRRGKLKIGRESCRERVCQYV